MRKIYSSINRSIEQIRSFSAGIIDAMQLKNLLFGQVPPIKKNVCPNPNQKTKRLTQEIPAEGQRPEKKSKHVHNSCNIEGPVSKSSGVKNTKLRTGRKIDPVTTETPTSLQGSDKSKVTLTPNPVQNKEKCLTPSGSAKGESPGELGNSGHNPCSTEAPMPSRTSGRKKKKSRAGKKTDPAPSFQGSDKSQKILTPNPCQKKKKRPAEGGLAKGQSLRKLGDNGLNPCITKAPTPSKTSGVKKKKCRIGIKIDPVTLNTPTSSQKLDKSLETLTKRVKKKKSMVGTKIDPVTSNTPTSQKLDKSLDTLTKSCQPLTALPFGGSGEYRSLGSGIGALNNATHSFQGGLCSTLPNQGPRNIAPQITHVRDPNHAASSFPVNGQPFVSNLPMEQHQRYGLPQTHVNTLSCAAARFPEGHPPYIYDTQSSGGFAPNRTHVDAWRHAAPNISQREALPVSGYGGSITEKYNFRTLKSAVPSFPSDQPLAHSHVQGYGGFRSESNHVETFRHTPNVQASPWVPVSDLRVQGPGELLPRMHVETPNYFASKSHSSVLANVAAGFGPERTHAASSFQTPLYTLGSRPSNMMRSHQPYIPTIPHRQPAGSQWSHDPRQPFPFVPSMLAPNMHPYQS